MANEIYADFDTIELELIIIPDKDNFWTIRRRDNRAELVWGYGNDITGGIIKPEFAKHASQIDLLALLTQLQKAMKE